MELSVPTTTEIIINYSSNIYKNVVRTPPFDNKCDGIFYFTIFLKKILFYYFLCAESSLLQGLFSGCGDQGLLSCARASPR